MKILKKVLFYSFLALLLVIISAVASVFLFKDRITQQFIREANKDLGTPVKIGAIDVSAFRNFPNLAIVFTDVYVEDSHPGEYPLLTAKTISFTLNPIEVWNGQYIIRALRMQDSETNLRINKAGMNNYTIVKPGDGGRAVSFDLKNIKLRNTRVSYIDASVAHHHEFSSDQLTATLTAVNDEYQIKATGDILSEQIGIGKSIFLRNKTTNIVARLVYDDLAKTLKIEPSDLSIEKTRLEVSGSYSFKVKNLIDLQVTGKDTDIQMLLTLLPESIAERLKKYQSKGDVYFDLKLIGEISKRRNPSLAVHFGLNNVTLYHPGSESLIEQANLEGSFEAPDLSKPGNAELSLKNITAILNGNPFKGNFVMKNLDNPYVEANFQGDLQAADILHFYPVQNISEFSGKVKANISLAGQVELLKNKSTAQQVRTEGTVELQDLNFLLGKEKLRFSHLAGSLQFNNNDLAMSNLGGEFENSDFLLNGFFKNIVTYLLFENQPVGIEADLKSHFLDVDQLFAIGFGGTERGPYQFGISPHLNLNFNCSVDSLQFKRFRATSVHGDLLVKGKVAVSRSIKLRAMGGTLDLSAIVDAKNPKAIELISSVNLDGIHIDSIFYVFDNFRQDFMEDKHLKGQTYAAINLEATLNEGLHIFPETFIADVSATIRNGELNNFEPLRKLNKYLDDDGLSKLRFADLKNDIHIENKTIFIPQMEIRSNVTVLQLSGTHTFGQAIDYRIVAPLRNKKKIDPDEAFGAVEHDLEGRSKVFLKITGTTEKYEVVYDKTAMKKKIISDLKREVQELKEALRLKGKKKKKELELEKDDYFDWENH